MKFSPKLRTKGFFRAKNTNLTLFSCEKTKQYRSKKAGNLSVLLRNYLVMGIFLKMVIFHYVQKNDNLYATKSHQQINRHTKMFSKMSSPSQQQKTAFKMMFCIKSQAFSLKNQVFRKKRIFRNSCFSKSYTKNNVRFAFFA